MQTSLSPHLLWIAREFGNPEYLPLSVDDLTALGGATTLTSFGSGARMFRADAPADACYLIRSGSVRIVRNGSKGRNGRPPILLAYLHSGQMVGDYTMLRGEAHSSDAIAHTPVSAIELPREATMSALAANPRIALRWLLAAMEQVEAAHGRMTMLLQRNARAKVAAFLLSSNGSQDGEGLIAISHEGLAEMVGVERATVSRAISSLRDSRLIQTTRGTIRILDHDGLNRIATL